MVKRHADTHRHCLPRTYTSTSNSSSCVELNPHVSVPWRLNLPANTHSTFSSSCIHAYPCEQVKPVIGAINATQDPNCSGRPISYDPNIHFEMFAKLVGLDTLQSIDSQYVRNALGQTGARTSITMEDILNPMK
jgi:hypothetical protein